MGDINETTIKTAHDFIKGKAPILSNVALLLVTLIGFYSIKLYNSIDSIIESERNATNIRIQKLHTEYQARNDLNQRELKEDIGELKADIRDLRAQILKLYGGR